jgi:pimeloyl-ACP methyl ester carboxylesterase
MTSGMRTVAGAGDLPLAVWTDGPPDAPPVLLVHGYPDTHAVWDLVVPELASDHFVIRYDVRGAGGSGAPARTGDYRLPLLAQDLFAVIAGTAGGRPVHVVGHDWGSVQAWEAVTAPEAAGRIASFTTISGPCLDHVGQLRRNRGVSLRQALHSWYVGAFHVPVLPALAWRALAPLWPSYLRSADGLEHVEVAPTLVSDAVNGINLYRANVLPRLRNPGERRTDLPVLQLELAHDRFVTADALVDVERWAPNLRRVPVESGHWVPLRRPRLVASLIRDHVAAT